MLARLRRIKVQLGLAQELKRRGLRLSYDEKTGRLLVSSAPKNYDWSDLTEIVWRSTGLFRPDSAQGVPSEESAPSQPVDLFFSYSHHDSLLREELEKQLSVVKRLGLVRTWHDGKIGPGADIDREVNKHLENSDLILLLVSPDFIASDYCWSTEMLRALERHRAGQARVVPIILRPCDWQVTVFGKLNALPKDGKAVVSAAWDSRDAAFYNVALGIRKTVEELLTRRDE